MTNAPMGVFSRPKLVSTKAVISPTAENSLQTSHAFMLSPSGMTQRDPGSQMNIQMRTAESNVFSPKGIEPKMPSVKSIQYLRENVYLAGNTTQGVPNGAMIIQGTNTPSHSGNFNQRLQTVDHNSEG